ncbi:DEAD/DEAH box helicase family protein [Bradyrhizobium sp. 193]|uniref:DEAD/DEAH box helicase family protein n=1 Tax=Bradyrhizobium sp. 193 TaxID=2782661 RepID=UPI001FF8C8C2|nr:DEAD/DEAH box helicase family protein [Bradyrhizobium sp. 193]MCK1485923.1 DEAD/DEAH box helicase family protein [Bradyrhizobium sp. 193]
MLKQLEKAYNEAIQQQATLRQRETTHFDRKIAESIFTAGLFAIEDSQRRIPRYNVVSAPTGSGKTSYALAFIKAYTDVAPSASVLFLVETIRQAEDIYQEIASLVTKAKLAIWTSAHDLTTAPETIRQDHGFVPDHRFYVEDLAKYPMVIVTQQFHAGPRGWRATTYNGNPRKLTFVDEKPAPLDIFDIDTGLIKTARDRLAEKHTADLAAVKHLTLLHDHLEGVWHSAPGKAPFDEIPEPNVDLSWFDTAHAIRIAASSDEQVRCVFGFARSLAQGLAFLSRYDQCGKGARFVGYDLKIRPSPGTVLLDATADIDGVSLITSDRRQVQVPQLRFSNLAITHIEADLKGYTVSETVKQAALARPYASWILETIKQNTDPGEKVLTVVHKALLDHEYLPGNDDFDNPYLLGERQVCFLNWGTGIGSNRWKDATAVFLFGEFYKPKRTMVATGLGLEQKQATTETLAPYQSPNVRGGPLHALREGDLCRWMKQIAMRGNARNIDGEGVCGDQRLYVTGEFDRLIENKERMFPGAKLAGHIPQGGRERRGAKGLVSLLYSTDALEITTIELDKLTGISFRKNKDRYLSNPVVQNAMEDTAFTFLAGKGRGNPGRFIRAADVAKAA